MPTDNAKKKQDAEMVDAYSRTPDELDEYAAAKDRLRAGPVNESDLRYVSKYEGGNAGPIHAMPKQGDGTPVNLDEEEPAPAVAAAPPPAPPPVTAQVSRVGVAPVAKEYATGGAPGLFVGALQDLRRRRQ